MARKVCEKTDCIYFDDDCSLHCSQNNACAHAADDLYQASDQLYGDEHSTGADVDPIEGKNHANPQSNPK